MATVLDALVIEIGLDPKKFKGGAAQIAADLKKLIENARKGGTDIEAQGKRTGEGIANLKREALGLVSLFLGGMGAKQFLNFVTNLDASTARLAVTTGIAARELSAWQGAVKEVGGEAGDATSALAGMNSEVQRFLLTGQGSFLPLLNAINVSLYKQNGQLKNASELYLDIADAIKKQNIDPTRAAALLGMVPGMNQNMLNLLIPGRGAVEERLARQRGLGGTDDKSAEEALKFQQSVADLERSATQLGRVVTTSVVPTLVFIMDAFSRVFGAMNTGKLGGTIDRSGAPAATSGEGFWNSIYRGIDKGLFGKGDSPADLHAIPPPRLTSGAKGDKVSGRSPADVSSMEAYIVKSAAARGIHPGIALAYFRSQTGGPAGGMADAFTKSTGLNAGDPSTFQAQVDFVLDQAKKDGGARWGRAGAAATAGSRNSVNNVGGNTSSSDVTITTMNVNTQATDADGIARSIKPALQRAGMGAAANFGQR